MSKHDDDYFKNDLHVAHKFIALHANAEKRDVDFSLSFSKLKQMLNQKKCYYTGRVFSETTRKSIDRVDSSKGYTDDNVVICTVDVNKLKSDLTLKELELIIKKTRLFESKRMNRNAIKIKID